MARIMTPLERIVPDKLHLTRNGTLAGVAIRPPTPQLTLQASQ
jgi:hypothetical protein